jgi:hypothetical protein
MTADLTEILAFRLGVIALTLIVARWKGLTLVVAFVGSAAASLGTGLLAVGVLRGDIAADGLLLVHRASSCQSRSSASDTSDTLTCGIVRHSLAPPSTSFWVPSSWCSRQPTPSRFSLHGS